MTFCPHTTPTAPCSECATCPIARDETAAERAERQRFTDSGKPAWVTFEFDLKGRSLVEWMAKTDVVDGKAIAVKQERRDRR